MKTVITLLVITIFQFNYAQENTVSSPKNKVWLGTIYSPRAFSTFDGGKPFDVTSVLYLVPTYATGKWAFAPFYNFNGNRTGVFTSYNINKNLGIYIFGDQDLDSNFGAYGIGATTPLYEDWINGFIEMGGSRGDNPEPAFLIGLYISLGKTIKVW